MLTKDQILANTKLKTVKVTVEAWGGEVIVSEMSAAARDAWEQAIMNRDENKNLINPRAKLIVATLVDEEGNHLFSENDIEEVSKLSSAIITKIASVAQELNGLTDKQLEAEKKS